MSLPLTRVPDPIRAPTGGTSSLMLMTWRPCPAQALWGNRPVHSDLNEMTLRCGYTYGT